MSRRSSFYNSKKNNSKASEDPFAEDDLSIDLTDMEKNYGKRTGKYYEPKKWKRTPSGFMEYLDDNDSED
jgi:hypothetical protein